MKFVRIRKERICEICFKPIRKGGTAIYERQVAYMSNQFLGESYYHEDCARSLKLSGLPIKKQEVKGEV